MWCAARHCAFESHPLRQKSADASASALLSFSQLIFERKEAVRMPHAAITMIPGRSEGAKFDR